MELPPIATLTVVAALVFGVVNGFYDAANSIGTLVSTRAVSPRKAVLWASSFTFLAFFVFHLGVAHTIAGLVRFAPGDPAAPYVVLCGVAGALLWNLLTYLSELPSSSSHALVGGLAGAGIAHGGIDAVSRDLLIPILEFVILAPLIALALGMTVMIALAWLFSRARLSTVRWVFRRGQLVSAAAYSLGHGGNDAQKTIGVIVAVMLVTGALAPEALAADGVPGWIALASYGCLALGTALGGWRIVRTMGLGVTPLKPAGGFSADVAGAVTLFVLTDHGVPVSTTQTITGAMVGVGSVTKLRGIRWGVATRIVWTWIITIPFAALVGGLTLAGARRLALW